MGAGCSSKTSVDLSGGRGAGGAPPLPAKRASSRVIDVGRRWRIRMKTSMPSAIMAATTGANNPDLARIREMELPPNGRHPMRSASNPAFVRSTTVPALKVGGGGGGGSPWKSNKKAVRATSEEITTVSESRTSRPNYHFVRERLLKWTPSTYHCRLFCGGPVCKYCDPNVFSNDSQAVPGLLSTWVTDEILATSRPTTSAIKRFDLFNALKSQNIVSVINLQRPYEHMHCGPSFPAKLEFSYDPEDFMKHGFFHYNFGWPDFGASTAACLLDMVKVLEFALTQGKVAVHCHAGLGRTGVLICAYLMWTKNFTPTEAIQLVRGRRPGSVQTSPQVDLLFEFDDLLISLRPIFDSSLTFEQHLKRQELILHGMEGRLLKHIPKIVFVCLERLLELAGFKSNGSLKQQLQTLKTCDADEQLQFSNRHIYQRRCSYSRRTSEDAMRHHHHPGRQRSYSNASTLAMDRPAAVASAVKKAGRGILVRFSTTEMRRASTLIDSPVLMNQLPPLPTAITCDRSRVMLVKGYDDGNATKSDANEKSREETKLRTSTTKDQNGNDRKDDQETRGRANGDRVCSSGDQVLRGADQENESSTIIDSEKWRCVFDAVLKTESANSEVVKLKEGISEKSISTRWDSMATETSGENVLFILRDWFLSLKEPVIPSDYAFDASNGRTRNLPKMVKWTILYCASVFNKLSSNDPELRNRCSRYLVECLTQKRDENISAENWFRATIECIREMDDIEDDGD